MQTLKRWATTFVVSVLVLTGAPAWADPQSPEVVASRLRGEHNKLIVQALPVLPWLVVGESSANTVKTELVRHDELRIGSSGVSAVTGGPLLNLAERKLRLASGAASIPGLRVLSLNFNPEGEQRLSYVSYMVERGTRDRFVQPMIERLVVAYQNYAKPIRVKDDRGETTDQYILFDLGRYVVEVSLGEGGVFFNVTFATRAIYERIRHANGAADLVLPYLCTQ